VRVFVQQHGLYCEKEFMKAGQYINLFRYLNNSLYLSACALYLFRVYVVTVQDLVLISMRGWVYLSDIVRPEGLCQRKNPVTPSGIEPETFRLLLQCLSEMRHREPLSLRVILLMPPIFFGGLGTSHLSGK